MNINPGSPFLTLAITAILTAGAAHGDERESQLVGRKALELKRLPAVEATGDDSVRPFATQSLPNQAAAMSSPNSLGLGVGASPKIDNQGATASEPALGFFRSLLSRRKKTATQPSPVVESPVTQASAIRQTSWPGEALGEELAEVNSVAMAPSNQSLFVESEPLKKAAPVAEPSKRRGMPAIISRVFGRSRRNEYAASKVIPASVLPASKTESTTDAAADADAKGAKVDEGLPGNLSLRYAVPNSFRTQLASEEEDLGSVASALPTMRSVRTPTSRQLSGAEPGVNELRLVDPRAESKVAAAPAPKGVDPRSAYRLAQQYAPVVAPPRELPPPSSEPLETRQSLPAIPTAAPRKNELPPPVRTVPRLAPALSEGEPSPTPTIDLVGDGEGTVSREVYLKAARNAVALGNFQEAIIRFKGLLESYPDDFEAMREYAGLLAQQGQASEAEGIYRRLIELAPSHGSVRREYANVLMQQSKFGLATRQLESALAEAPEDTEIAISLARSYGLSGQQEQAMRVYSERLSKLDPRDPSVQKSLAELLMELQRADLALDYLLRLRGGRPDDMAIAANIGRAYSQLGQVAAVRGLIDEIHGVAPEAIGERLKLAKELAEAEQPLSALALYQQVFEYDPENFKAHVGTARVLLNIFEPQMAADLLGQLPQHCSLEVQLLRVKYYRIVGEYAEAEALSSELIRQYPQDHRVLVELGQTYQDAQLYLKAASTFQRALAISPANNDIRIKLARSHRAAARYGKSSAVCRVVLAEDPDNIEAFRILIENLLSTGCCEEANYMSSQRLAASSLYARGKVELYLVRGRVLLECGKPVDALRHYKTAACMPAGRVPEAYYGMYASYRRLGQIDAGRHAMAPVLAASSPNAYARIRVAQLALVDCDYQLANELLGQVLRFCTYHNAVAQLLLGEANSACVTCCNAGTAIKAYNAVLSHSPGNIRGRVGLARVYTASQCCCEAVSHYNQVMTYMPSNTVAATERARAIEQCDGYCAADYAYRSAAATAEHIDPVYPIDPLIDSTCQLPAYQSEFFSSELAARIIRVENLAKYNKRWRAYASIDHFKRLTALQPWNQDAYFELGQQYSYVNETCREIAAYQCLLALNPCHCDAKLALCGAQARLAPALIGDFEFFSQEGRDGLALIDRYRWGVLAHLVTGDENEYWRAGYRARLLVPDEVGSVSGHGAYVRRQVKIKNRTLAFGEIDAQVWDNLVDSRPEFDLGVQQSLGDTTQLRAGLQLANVLESGGSLFQDIYRFGFRGEVESMLTRRWRTFGRYRYWDYSDGNAAHEFSIHNAYQLTNTPRRLELLLNYDYWSYAEASIPGTSSVTTVHPYFSPRGYSQIGTHLDYTAWASERSYKGAPHAWVAFRYGIKFDSQSQFFNVVQARAHRDWGNRFSAEAMAFHENSEFYQATGVTASLVVRFP